MDNADSPRGNASDLSDGARPLPSKRARLPLSRAFTREEWAVIRKGFRPTAMEDKWLIHAKDGWLWFHRSWTGFCVFGARVEETGDGARMIEAWANRDESQYKATDDARDAAIMSWLIDVLLLGRAAEWPDSGLGPMAPLEQWAMVGRAMLTHDTDGSVAKKLNEALEKAPDAPGDPRPSRKET